MSFKTNDVEQLSLFDSFLNLTAREQKALENSWAKVFAEEVFPKIDEKPFAALASPTLDYNFTALLRRERFSCRISA